MDTLKEEQVMALVKKTLEELSQAKSWNVADAEVTLANLNGADSFERLRAYSDSEVKLSTDSFEELDNYTIDSQLVDRARELSGSGKFVNVSLDAFKSMNSIQQGVTLVVASVVQGYPIRPRNLALLVASVGTFIVSCTLPIKNIDKTVIVSRMIMVALMAEVLKVEIQNHEMWLKDKGEESSYFYIFISRLAERDNCRPAMIASSVEQRELLRVRPTTIDMLVTVKGYPRNSKRVEKWGKDFCRFFEHCVELEEVTVGEGVSRREVTVPYGLRLVSGIERNALGKESDI